MGDIRLKVLMDGNELILKGNLMYGDGFAFDLVQPGVEVAGTATEYEGILLDYENENPDVNWELDDTDRYSIACKVVSDNLLKPLVLIRDHLKGVVFTVPDVEGIFEYGLGEIEVTMIKLFNVKNEMIKDPVGPTKFVVFNFGIGTLDTYEFVNTKRIFSSTKVVVNQLSFSAHLLGSVEEVCGPGCLISNLLVYFDGSRYVTKGIGFTNSKNIIISAG